MTTKESDPIKILLADDDADDCELFMQAVTETQANTILTTVDDGLKLLEYLYKKDAELPDIIFLDINMPSKNGKECLKEIRSGTKFQHIPVIIFTTSAFKLDIEETFANGANLYITKPAFYNDEVDLLKKIFSLNWKEDFLKTKRENYVYTDTYFLSIQ